MVINCTQDQWNTIYTALLKEYKEHQGTGSVAETFLEDALEAVRAALNTNEKSKGKMITKVLCIKDFVEDGDLCWTKGCYYNVVEMDGDDYLIEHNFGGVGRIYPDDFDDYFKEDQ